MQGNPELVPPSLSLSPSPAAAAHLPPPAPPQPARKDADPDVGSLLRCCLNVLDPVAPPQSHPPLSNTNTPAVLFYRICSLCLRAVAPRSALETDGDFTGLVLTHPRGSCALLSSRRTGTSEASTARLEAGTKRR